MAATTQLVLRLPPSLHDALRAEAAKRGTSMNALAIEALAGLLDWEPPKD